jgi:nondiscriminating glutamyl-tRNA synthetase
MRWLSFLGSNMEDTGSTFRVRYAPSPTGLLHVGNLRTGLFAWLFARQNGGSFVLRIEDTDRARSERGYEQSIYEDLRWFGMDWDEGPDIGGAYGPYRQSERYDIYREHASQLIAKGAAFRCFCSEEELAGQSEAAKAKGVSWTYPGTCRNLAPEAADLRVKAGEAPVVRLKVPEGTVRFEDIVHGQMQFSTEVISDPILLRSDRTPTYNYAVVVDDALMGISHVIRGDDHLSNTPKQVLIYEALGFPKPSFAHLSTILGPDQTRLSKRHGATAVAQFREVGYLPEALMNYIALLGWSPGAEGSEVVPPDRLVQEFRLDKVNKNPAIFDFGKLNFINRQYLRESPRTESLVRAALGRTGWLPETGADDWVRMVSATLIGGVDIVSEIPSVLESVLAFPVDDSEAVSEAVGDDGVLDLIRAFAEELNACDPLTFDGFRAIVTSLKKTTGRKGRDLFHPLRVALTARDSGPELDKLIPLVELGAKLSVPGALDCGARVKSFLSKQASA